MNVMQIFTYGLGKTLFQVFWILIGYYQMSDPCYKVKMHILQMMFSMANLFYKLLSMFSLFIWKLISRTLR